MECQYCKNTFKSVNGLQTHQKRAKYCLKIQKDQGISVIAKMFICEYCSIEIAIEDHDT